MTLFQLELLAQAPWTSTMFRTAWSPLSFTCICSWALPALQKSRPQQDGCGDA